MENISKNKYEKWLNGDLYFDHFQLVFSDPLKRGDFEVISWGDLDSDSQQKIQAKQKEIFNELFEKKMKIILADFNEKFRNSRAKYMLLSLTIYQIKLIVSGSLRRSGDFYITDDSILPLSLEQNYYNDILTYISRHIIQGRPYSYSDIHSSYSKLIPSDFTPPQVMAEVFLLFLKYLTDLSNGLKENTNSKQEKYNELVFSNAQAYIIHQESLNSIKSDKYYKDALVQAVFHYLKEKGCIEEKCQEKQYILFLKSNHPTIVLSPKIERLKKKIPKYIKDQIDQILNNHNW